MYLVPALVCALLGAGGGWFVPRLIASVPEPKPDPDEDPEDFPEKVLYADLADRPGLAWRCSLACAVGGAAIGAVIGWGWALTWLMFLVPVCCALSVIDYVTWFLPTRIIAPSYGVVAVLVAGAAAITGELSVALAGLLGWLGLGLYYGLLWFISPRIMAYGDVRLGGLLGLALGPLGLGTVMLSVLLAGVIGTLSFVPLRLRGNTIKRHVPFGPFLVLGALAAVVAGEAITGLWAA